MSPLLYWTLDFERGWDLDLGLTICLEIYYFFEHHHHHPYFLSFVIVQKN